MQKPIKFRTQRGNRVFRLGFRYKGAQKFSEVYTFRVKRHGKQFDFNLGSEKRTAGKKADEIAAFLAVRTHPIEDAIARFSPEKALRSESTEGDKSTVGALVRRYEEVAHHLRPATIRDNLGSLRRIAAFILGLAPIRKASKERLARWREEVNALPLDKLTAEQIEKFRSSMLKSAEGNTSRKARAITTSNFYCRAAASIFSKKLLKHYSGFILPNPSPFEDIKQLPESPHRYVSVIDAGELLSKAQKELRLQHPGSYVAFLLSLCCGMRRAEIDRLTWEQIDDSKGHIWIRTTDHFAPKAKNSENRIDAPEMVFSALKEFSPLSITPPFVLPGGDPVYPPRCKHVFRTLLTWLRRNGVNHVQALHALRKEAGSLMFAQTGSIDQAAEFLRNDPRVAREHYIGRKGRLELQMPSVTT
jgi:integrase